MNCKNCNCPDCVRDRNLSDLQKHRLRVISRWFWNCSPREAAAKIREEVDAGRGGSKRDWAREVDAELPHRDSVAVLRLLGDLDDR